MMSSSSDGVDVVRPAVIEVLWRPGCPFCTRLLRELSRSGVITTERDIWSDPDAAARVRAATGGDETVPTVVVGDRALVNPRLAQVVAAVREEFPDEADTLLGSAADRPVTPVWREGALAGLVVAVLWVVLAAWEPTTTWHLAPFLAGAAPPWLLSRGAGPSRGGPPLLRRVAAISGAAAVGLTLALWALGLLRGPVLTGSGPAVGESVVLALLGPMVVVVLAARRARKGR